MTGTFRDWPSKVVVEGTTPDTNTYIGYSPIPGARLADAVWVVERIDAVGSNAFAEDCLKHGETDPEPCVAMDDPASLTFAARSEA